MFRMRSIKLLVLEALLLHTLISIIIARQIALNAYYALGSVVSDNMHYISYQSI